MTSVSLQEWILRAASSIPSPEEYLESAVCVALELANTLNLNLEVGTSSLCSDICNYNYSPTSSINSSKKEHKCDDDSTSTSPMHPHQLGIVSENIVVHIAKNQDPSPPDVTAVTSVEIRCSSIETISQHSSCGVCPALGRILFEILSKGQPISTMEIEEMPLFEDLFVCDDVLFGYCGPDTAVPDQNRSKRTRSEAVGSASAANTKLSSGNTSHAAASKGMKAISFLQENCRLPFSICQLVCDLLESDGRDNQFVSDSSAITLEDVCIELHRMKTYPMKFLYDQTCPSKALKDTGLFQPMTDISLYGRGHEQNILMNAAERIAMHVLSSHSEEQFLCEAVFLAGHAGSGKSSLCNHLISSCNASIGNVKWSVLSCKFDRQVAPLQTFAKAVNDFFEQFVTIEALSQDKISHSIITSLDKEGLLHLCELMPAFNRLFPLSASCSQSTSQQDTASTGHVGSGRNRLHSLFHLIIKLIFCGGCPVLIVLDDLQWSDGLAMDVISDVIETSKFQSNVMGSGTDETHGGLILLGSYRTYEADTNLLSQIQAMDQNNSGHIKVTQLPIGELPWQDVNKMISFKLGQQMQRTRKLTDIIFQKTRGLPLFVVQFLRSIISKNILTFSVRSRQWTWDDLVLDLLTISEDVAEFLAHRLSCLDKEILDAMKVCACIGFQVDELLFPLLQLGHFVPDFEKSIYLALEEGLMDKAGPIYAFSHDVLRESAYKLIPESDRKPLKKRIGLCLAQHADMANNADICTIAAVDQVNACSDILGPFERTSFARLNLAAGIYSMTSSSYSQARGYFEAGIALLKANHGDKQYHWNEQYHLCLDLYEMSVIVGFMDGHVENMESRLGAILSNARSFEDTLKAKRLHLKMISSRGDYAEATRQCLTVLSKLGEHFPERIDSSVVNDEISRTESLLKDVTKDHLMRLPVMTDKSKTFSMAFLNMLCTFSMFSQPNICHLSCCYMVKLTLEHGFCDESIIGLATFSRTLLLETDDVGTASRIGSLAESFLVGHNNEHAIRAKLTILVNAAVKSFVQPWQSVTEACLNGYKSGMIVGDVENGLLCANINCLSNFHIGSELKALQGTAQNYARQMTKHNQIGLLYGVMSVFDACAVLTGCHDTGLGFKNNKEISKIAIETKNTFLLHHVYIQRMCVHSYCREYMSVLELADMHRTLKVKRILEIIKIFHVGISALGVARDTRQDKWRHIGEESVKVMAHVVQYSKWNFTNKLHLLQAELHYLNGNLRAAEMSYKLSILCAQKHKFLHEEALAKELLAMFFIENKLADSGLDYLEMSMQKYSEWGADVKVRDIKSFIELVNCALNPSCR